MNIKPIDSYPGSVREVVIGRGKKALKIGGENILPLHFFDEGSCPNPTRFSLEIWDVEPTDWAWWVLEPFKDVVFDPIRWAKRCEEFGADAVCLKLVSTDPAGRNASPEEAAALAKKIAEEINVPLIVYGSGDEKKDALVLPKVAEACDGENLLLGPAQKGNYKEVGMATLKHGHAIITQSPVDINLLKELNIKLSKFFPIDRIVIDPLSPALGYGFEYGFSLIERVKQTAIIFEEEVTQMPIIADLGGECWKTREAKESEEQGIMWEAITALSLLLAGANILVLRHPETMRMVKEVIGNG